MRTSLIVVFVVGFLVMTCVGVMTAVLLTAKRRKRRMHAQHGAIAKAQLIPAKPSVGAYWTYINREVDTQRRRNMEAMLQRLRLPFPVKRMEACIPGSDFTTRIEEYAPNLKELLRPGELGVYASHVKIMLEHLQDASVSEEDWVCMMEDDAYVNGSVTEAAASARITDLLLRDTTPDVGMLQLGSCYHEASHQELLPRGRHSTPPGVRHGWGIGLTAYCMRKWAIRQFVQSPFFLQTPIDVDLYWFAAAMNADGRYRALIVDLPWRRHFQGFLVQDGTDTSTQTPMTSLLQQSRDAVFGFAINFEDNWNELPRKKLAAIMEQYNDLPQRPPYEQLLSSDAAKV